MESRRRRAPLNLLVVTSLVLSGVLGSSSRPALCDVSCCFVLPSCDNARVVTCDCPNLETITLRKDDIPHTVREVNIFNTSSVTIDKDAISGLQNLTNFIITGITTLKINQDGMASHEGAKRRSVTFQKIKSLQMDTKSISGVWQPMAKIRMHQIDVLHIKPYAFDYQIAKHGLIVSLQHVKKLVLNKFGLSSLIFKLIMDNVSMEVCHNGSFGGHTYTTEMNTVSISAADHLCFNAKNSHSSLKMNALKIEEAFPNAISGNMHTLYIQDSHFNTIHPRGFNIRVERIQVSNSNISDLKNNGFNVTANVDIRLELLNITDLRTNALAGLRMKYRPVGVTQSETINQFTISKAEPGSLTLSDKSNFRNLKMNCMQVVSCTTRPEVYSEKCVRMLVAANQNETLSLAQRVVFESVIGNESCTEGHFQGIDLHPLGNQGIMNNDNDDFAADDLAAPEENTRSNIQGLDNVYEEIHRTHVLNLVFTLSLAVMVMVTLLLIILAFRRHRSRKQAIHQSINIPLRSVEDLAGRQHSGDHGHEERSVLREQISNESNRPGNQISSRERTSYDDHLYETIEDEFNLLP